jgi:mannosyltransferase
MRIYLDNIIFSLQKAGGISVYWYELTRRLAAATEVFFINGHTSDNNLFGRQLRIGSGNRISELPLPAKRYLPVAARLQGPSLFHSSYYRACLQANIANVVTAYDFTYELYRRGLPRIVNILQKRLALARADGIICISEHTRRDLLRFYPTTRRKPQKVIYLDVDERFRPLGEEGRYPVVANPSEQRTILFVGDRKQAYKNFELAVQAVGSLPGFRLAVVGSQPLSLAETAFVKRHLGDRCRVYPPLDTPGLNQIYNRAFCLLYPSLYEGFGLPVLEAMRAGCPVITTGRASIPEVGGNAAFCLKEISIAGIVAAVKQLEDPSVRATMIINGFSQARRFSWQRCVDETLVFYRNIYHDRFVDPNNQPTTASK